MINRCKPCSFLESVTVAYAVTGSGPDTLTLTITDTKCVANDSKMIRAILGKALCQIYGAAGWTFTSDPSTNIGSVAGCGNIPVYSTVVWDFEGKALAITQANIAGPASSGNLTVETPFVDVV